MKDKEIEIKIAVGAMSPPLSKQLESQGAKVDKADMYEKNLDAVTRLLMCGYLPPSAADSCRKKIVKDVFKNIQAL